MNNLEYYVNRLIARIFYFKINKFGLYLNYIPDSAGDLYLSDYNKYIEDYIKGCRLNNNGDLTRMFSFILNINQVLSDNVLGDFAELGVWRGNTASILVKFAVQANRKLYLFDTFQGFNDKDILEVDCNAVRGQFSNTNLEVVKAILGDNSQYSLEIGYFPDSVTTFHEENIYAVVSLDCDLYEPMKAGLDFFFKRLSPGGILFLHDYSSGKWPGTKKAIDEYFINKSESIILMPDKSGSAFVRKQK